MSHVQVLRHAIEAARAGDTALARRHLQTAVETEPDDPVVWLWMSWLADSPLRMVQGLALAGRHAAYREIADSGLRFARALARFDCDSLERERSQWNSPGSGMPPGQTEDGAAVDHTHAENPHTGPGRPADVAADSNEFEQTTARSLHGVELLSHTADAVAGELQSSSNAEVDWTDLSSGFVTGRTSDGAEWHARDTGSQAAVTSHQEFMGEPTAGEGTSWYDGWLPESHRTTAEADPGSSAVDHGMAGLSSRWQAAADSPPARQPDSQARTWSQDLDRETVADWSTRSLETSVEESASEEPVARSMDAEKSGTQRSDGMIPDRDFDQQANAAGYVAPVARAAFQIPPELVSNSESVMSQPIFKDRQVNGTNSDGEPPATLSRGWMPPEPVHGSAGIWPEVQTSWFDVNDSSAGIWIPHNDSLETATLTPDAVVPQAPLPDMPEDAESLSPQKTTASECRTVLVVDNGLAIRNLIQTSLEQHGFHVVHAVDGATAVQEIVRETPALILMDVSLPKLDGYQLCRLVRQQESTRQIPVVMLTSRESLFDRLRSRMAGCSGCLTKPFTPEQLVTAVERHLAEPVVTIDSAR